MGGRPIIGDVTGAAKSGAGDFRITQIGRDTLHVNDVSYFDYLLAALSAVDVPPSVAQVAPFPQLRLPMLLGALDLAVSSIPQLQKRPRHVTPSVIDP